MISYNMVTTLKGRKLLKAGIQSTNCRGSFDISYMSEISYYNKDIVLYQDITCHLQFLVIVEISIVQ